MRVLYVYSRVLIVIFGMGSLCVVVVIVVRRSLVLFVFWMVLFIIIVVIWMLRFVFGVCIFILCFVNMCLVGYLVVWVCWRLLFVLYLGLCLCFLFCIVVFFYRWCRLGVWLVFIVMLVVVCCLL